jgi:acyl-CoA dehydrogenase
MSADELVMSTADRILGQFCTFEAIEQAEKDGWAASIWEPLAEAGMPYVGVSEDAGGVGGALGDALGVVRLVGRHAAPIPFAENGLLAGWLLELAGLKIEHPVTTIVPGCVGDTVGVDGAVLIGTAHEVPWARHAQRIVLLVEDQSGCKVAVVDTADARITPLTNLAGEPRDLVHFDSTPLQALVPVDLSRADLNRRGALARTQMMAGALERMYDLTVAYTADRQQFGRPVSRFQLVQAHLVHLAQDAAMLCLAADAAAKAAESGDAAFEIGAARVIACSAATSATRSAHQAHGAMGMTREYPLHHFSRRLWAWRREFGQEHDWRLEVGRLASRAGADELYPLITR